MSKKDKKITIVTSILCVLPAILSLALYSELPLKIAVHWNSAGEADQYFHKAVAAFGLPGFFLLINLFSKIRLFNDPKRAAQSTAIHNFSVWAIPSLSLVINPITLFIALGVDIPIVMVTEILLGLTLIVLGNYLPKSRQNYTVGIKLPWTIDDADNWNKTHRLAGYVYMLGGVAVIVVSMITVFAKFANLPIVIAIVVAIIIIPLLYSYVLYRRKAT